MKKSVIAAALAVGFALTSMAAPAQAYHRGSPTPTSAVCTSNYNSSGVDRIVITWLLTEGKPSSLEARYTVASGKPALVFKNLTHTNYATGSYSTTVPLGSCTDLFQGWGLNRNGGGSSFFTFN